MVRTRVGYAGGTTNNPTYYNIGDHSETVQMDYDPARVSYEKLLDVFWNSHDPTFQQSLQQYASIIFYHSEEQKRLEMESKQRVEARLGKEVFTEIIPIAKFYLAEDYHQKFYLQQTPELMKDIAAVYPKFEDFISSTTAARLNGYAGGFGTEEAAKEQLNNLGLSEAGKEKLLQIAESGLVAACPAR